MKDKKKGKRKPKIEHGKPRKQHNHDNLDFLSELSELCHRLFLNSSRQIYPGKVLLWDIQDQILGENFPE